MPACPSPGIQESGVPAPGPRHSLCGAAPMLGPFTGLSMPNTTQLVPDLLHVLGQFYPRSLPGEVKEGVFL